MAANYNFTNQTTEQLLTFVLLLEPTISVVTESWPEAEGLLMGSVPTVRDKSVCAGRKGRES